MQNQSLSKLNSQAISYKSVTGGPSCGERASAPASCVYAHTPTPRAFIRATIRRVAEAHGFSYERVVSEDRCRSVCAARHNAIVAVRAEHPRLSTDAIARMFGISYAATHKVLSMRHNAFGLRVWRGAA